MAFISSHQNNEASYVRPAIPTISGQAALVAGGASGLGEATVRCLVEADAFAIVLDRDRSRGEALADELGDSVCFVHGDICQEADVLMALSAAGSRSLRLAVICAFAGGGGALLEQDGSPKALEEFRAAAEVNYVGTFNVMRLAASHMSRNEPDDDGGRGVIVTTGSITAFDGQNFQIAYASSKAAVVGMSLPAARDLRPFGIRVMCIAPGIFLTPEVARADEDLRRFYERTTTFPRRLGHADEYARLVMHIYSNGYLNGETIRLDAGARLPAIDS
jgi:NAD(P)-dependent dehydrogenase (short-subunit alcohol dehydrogenase family)